MAPRLAGPSYLLGVLALATPLVVAGAAAGPSYGRAAAAYQCAGVPATITGTPGLDRLVGTRGRDVIVGRQGDDDIDGRGGNDLLCGGDGADLLRGGPGADRLRGGPGRLGLDRGGDPVVVGDVLYGGPGNDWFVGGVDHRAPQARPDQVRFDTAVRGVRVDLETLTGRGQGADRFADQRWRLTGSRYADTLLGSDGPDVIEGGLGDDTIAGRGGNDRLTGDPARGRPGPDADTVHGGPGDDVVQARAGADRLYGDSGQDGVFDWGFRGADLVLGGTGQDSASNVLTDVAGERVAGGGGYDFVGISTHVVRGGSVVRPSGAVDLADGTGTLRWADRRRAFVVGSTESLTLPAGAWTAYGSEADDQLRAAGGPARLYGRDGDDLLWGTERGDFLAGGSGADSGYPFAGQDICVSVESVATDEGACEERRGTG